MSTTKGKKMTDENGNRHKGPLKSFNCPPELSAKVEAFREAEEKRIGYRINQTQAMCALLTRGLAAASVK
jgi:hypothetical protein